MMFTDELRIGNWVQRIGFPLKVTGIKGSDVWVDGNGVELEYYIYDGINPIPLTEEWLVKFGFEEDGPDWYFMSTKDRFTDIGYSYSVKKNIFEVNEWEMVEVKYVHQLQNIYFALTGEEL